MRGPAPLFWVVFLVAFSLRALFLLMGGLGSENAIRIDSTQYIELAQTLREEKQFSFRSGSTLQPETMRTPGFPLFLTFFFKNGEFQIDQAQWAQVVLGAMTASFVGLLTLKLWNHRFAALLAGLAMAVDWVAIFNTFFILTETLYVFLLSIWLTALISFFKRKNGKSWVAVFLGIGFGFICLVRPITLYFLPFLFIGSLGFFFLTKNSRLPRVAFYLLFGSGLVIGGWCSRNYVQINQWTFTPLGSTVLQNIRLPLLEMERTGKSYSEALASLEEKSYFKYIAHHPLVFTKVMVKDTIRFFVGNSMKPTAWILTKDDRYNPNNLQDIQTEGLLSQAIHLIQNHPFIGFGMIVYLIFLGLVYLFSVLGLRWAWIDSPSLAIIMVSLILYFLLVTVGAVAMSRYRLPAMICFFPLAAGGALLIQKLRLNTT